MSDDRENNGDNKVKRTAGGQFAKGTAKPEGAGIKQGQKQKRTMLKEALEAAGLNLEDIIAGQIQRAHERLREAIESGKPREIRAAEAWLAECMKDLKPYTFPKLRSVDHTTNGERIAGLSEEDRGILDRIMAGGGDGDTGE